MPSYTYRCLHCGQTDTLAQSVQEAFAPACSACGGLTERYIGQVPTILKSTNESERVQQAQPAPETHSTCALHHYHQHGPGCSHH